MTTVNRGLVERAPAVLYKPKPSRHGAVAWAGDPIDIQAATLMTAGTLLWQTVEVPEYRTISELILSFGGSNGSTLSGATAALWLINSLTGTRQWISADQATNWATTGEKRLAVTPFSYGGYDQRLGISVLVVSATTMPSIHRFGSSSVANNLGLTAGTDLLRVGQLSGQTGTPAGPLDLTTLAVGAIAFAALLR